VLDRAAEAGIERILVPGYDLASSEAALALATRRPEMLVAGVGVHPHHASGTDEAAWARLEQLVRETAVVAVGEIGLDFFRNLSPPDVQREAFDRQLALAAGCELPVLVHDRDAHQEVLGALLAWEGRTRSSARGVLHAFSGDLAMARSAVGVGFLVSFALPVAFRSATGPREAAAALDAGRFLVETDAPWLAPGGTAARNEPTTVLRVVGELARLRDEPPETLTASVRDAFERLVAMAQPLHPSAATPS